MLQELYKNVTKNFPATELENATENALDKKARPILSEMCTKYDDLPSVSKVAAIQEHVDSVQAMMETNIAHQLKNLEIADDMTQKADNLSEQAAVFKKQTSTLRKIMAWKNLKMTLLLGGILAVILVSILAPLIVRSNWTQEITFFMKPSDQQQWFHEP